MQIKHLHTSLIPQIHQCWMEAFSDYQIDMSYLTLERMIHRARMDRVNFELSVGAFDDQKMIGFTLIGQDKWRGKNYAYDAGTGIIKKYRGQGIAGKMFDFSLEALKKIDTEYFALEVIQNNEAAVKAYQKAGFEILKEYQCYILDIKNLTSIEKTVSGIEIRRIKKELLSTVAHLLDYEPSWEYNESAIAAIEDDFHVYAAFNGEQCLAYIAYYPRLHWIFQLGVMKEWKTKLEGLLLSELVNKFRNQTNEIKFHNIASNNDLNKILEKHGFRHYADQYEMIKKL